jgi:hypothetical protein
MPILSFERAVNIVKEEHQIIKIKVLKDGPEAADCYLTFTGTTNYSKAKYPDRAVKSTKGDFYAKNQTLTWETGDVEPKEVTIEIFSDKEEERAEMFYVTMKSENAEIGIEKTYYYIVEDIKSFLSQTAIANNVSINMGKGMSLIEGINSNFKCVSVDTFGMVIPEEANVGPDVTYVENELVWSLFNTKLVHFTGRINIIGVYTKEHKDNVQYWYEEYGEEISPYRIITLSLPFTNVSKYPTAVTVSSPYAEGFYRGTTDKVINSLKAYIAPNSNLLFFEVAVGDYLTNLVALQNNFVLQSSLSGTVYIDPNNISLPTPSKSEYHYWT